MSSEGPQQSDDLTIDDIKRLLVEETRKVKTGEAARKRRTALIIRAIAYGMHQKEVADLCDMTQSAVSKMGPNVDHRVVHGRYRKTT